MGPVFVLCVLFGKISDRMASGSRWTVSIEGYLTSGRNVGCGSIGVLVALAQEGP
jgi:hypothetical protein